MASPAETEVVHPAHSAETEENAEKIVADRQQAKSSSGDENRLSFALAKRPSWNRALSTRGRTSIAASLRPPDQGKPRRKKKPPLPRGKNIQPPSYDRELAYFKEVDSFELLVESPSPKKFDTMGVTTDPMTHLQYVLLNWLNAQRRKNSCAPLPSITRILETPAIGKDSIVGYECESCRLKKNSPQTSLHVYPPQVRIDFGAINESRSRNRITPESGSEKFQTVVEESSEDIEAAVSKLSLSSRPDSLSSQSWDPFSALLVACKQSAPSSFLDVLEKYRDTKRIVKVGEGTFGEAFKVGGAVFKIVPFDGAVRVNGEVQKKSEELLEEVMLSSTLNDLRGCEIHASNACTSFIQTMELKVCCGPYDAALIEAWEMWDEEHGSENDNPKDIPAENQCYVVFVQEHGGQDLESFVLLNYDEARSLLVQVTLALAVAEAAYEFEHRDLHWGNILLRRGDSKSQCFTLEGRKLHVKTYGLSISIIDFTLSRLKTGDDILFLDLSLDPELFEGPKGHKQFDTYRKMKEVTDECWEGSFPKTNVLWLEYLVHIVMSKKLTKRTSKDRKESMGLFMNRLSNYNSAKDAVDDPFFSNLFVNL